MENNPHDENRDFVRAIVKSLANIEKSIKDQGGNAAAKALEKINEKLESVSASVKGNDGKTPKKGVDYDDGEPGKDGVSIVSAKLDKLGKLILTLSNEKEIDVGLVRGRDGLDSSYNEDELVEKVLSKIPAPKPIDEAALIKKVIAALPEPKRESGKEIIKKIRDAKELSYQDLKDLPDLVAIIKKYTAHLEGSRVIAGATAISRLTDVDLAGLVDGNTLVWDADVQKFVPGVGGGGGGIESIVAGTGITIDDTDPANPIVSATGGGAGDMLAATYDPQNIAADAFDRTNHTGEQAISTVTDLQTALDSKIEDLTGFTTDDLTQGSTNLYSQWETATGGINYAGGKVGIGTSTPSQKLTISGGTIQLDNSQFVRWNNAAGVSGRVIGTDLSDNVVFGDLDNNYGSFIIRTGNNTDRLTILETGEVGIGTTPASSVRLTVNQTSAGAAVTVLKLQNTSSAASAGVNLDFAISSSGTVLARQSAVRDSPGNTDIIWSNYSGSLTEKMRLNSDGELGVGVASPQSKLHVLGGAIRVTTESSATDYANRKDAIIFTRNDFQTAYLNKITSSHSGTANSSTMNFELASGAATFANALTLTGAGKAGFGGITTPLGVVSFPYTNFHTAQRTLPTTVGDAVDIGSFTLTNGSGNFEIWITVPSSGYSQTKRYFLPAAYNGAVTWQKVLPISTTGPYTVNDIDLEINSSGSVTSFRLRRTSGTTAAIANITILQQGVDTNGFTESTASSTVTAPTTIYGKNEAEGFLSDFVGVNMTAGSLNTTRSWASLQVGDTPAQIGSFSLSSWNSTGNRVPALFIAPAHNGGNTPVTGTPALVLGREGVANEAYGNFVEFKVRRYEDSASSARSAFDIALTHGNGDAAGTDVMSLLSNGNVGIGTTAPSVRLHTISTTEQLRLGYDTSNYFSTTVSSAGAVTFNAVGSGAGFVFSDKVKFTSAYFDEIDNGNSSTADTIDWTTSNKQKSTLTGNVTYTFTAPGGPCNLILKVLTGTGGFTITWPATVKWSGGTAPTPTSTASRLDIYSFYYDGTNFYGQAALNFTP